VVITDDPPHLVGRRLRERFLALGGLKPGGRLPDLAVVARKVADILVLDRLGFEDEFAVNPVDQDVERAPPVGRVASVSVDSLG
jgi:hypothetical protein